MFRRFLFRRKDDTKRHFATCHLPRPIDYLLLHFTKKPRFITGAFCRRKSINLFVWTERLGSFQRIGYGSSDTGKQIGFHRIRITVQRWRPHQQKESHRHSILL